MRKNINLCGVIIVLILAGVSFGCKEPDYDWLPGEIKQIGVIFYKLNSGGTECSVVGYNIGYESYNAPWLVNVIIPISVYGYPVTAIDDRAFMDCGVLTSITIPNSITRIGLNPFSNCSSLTEINVSTNNQNYSSSDGILYNKNKSAIVGISGAKIGSLSISSSVMSIGAYAFEGCKLTSITIPNSVTSIGSYAFYNCSKLTSITIPNGVTSIGSYTFYGCASLTSITIPSSVTSIDYYAFYNCSKLTSITIPNGVTSIGSYTFYGCTSLTSITIPSSVTSIGGSAFSDCSKLTSITIPSNVTSIGNYAFYNCNGLTSITIKANLNIDSSTFPGNFVAAYNNDGKLAGTYTRPNTSSNIWTRQ